MLKETSPAALGQWNFQLCTNTTTSSKKQQTQIFTISLFNWKTKDPKIASVHKHRCWP